MRLRLLVPVVAVVGLAACNLLLGNVTVPTGNCKVDSLKRCSEFTEADQGYISVARTACTALGGALTENKLCDPAGAIGGCHYDDGNALLTVWYFPGNDKNYTAADSIVGDCKGWFVDTNRVEYISDAGLPNNCIGAVFADGGVLTHLHNGSPVTFNVSRCRLPGASGPTVFTTVDAGTTFDLTAPQGQSLHFLVGNIFQKTALVPATESTVELP